MQHSSSSFHDWQKVAHNQGRTAIYVSHEQTDGTNHDKNSHVVGITLDSKRKAAFQLLTPGFWIRALQRAARKDGLLGRVESNGSEFLPVADQ